MKTHIVLHHSATKDSGTVSWNAIRRYHEAQGWNGIGYHGGVEWVLDAAGHGHYEFLLGRPFDAPGAHCYQQNMNEVGIGIVFVGDFDAAAPNPMMLDFAAPHIAALMRLFGIPTDRVKRHSDFAPKTCPGKLFPWDTYLRTLRGA